MLQMSWVTSLTAVLGWHGARAARELRRILCGKKHHGCLWWVRRELQDSPKQILGGLPTHPDEYAALGPAIAPRPRTIKLVREAVVPCCLPRVRFALETAVSLSHVGQRSAANRAHILGGVDQSRAASGVLAVLSSACSKGRSKVALTPGRPGRWACWA